MQLVLGGYTFSSKKNLKERLSSFLKNAKGGDFIRDKKQILVLQDLINLHYDSERKVGKGVLCFFVYQNKIG